MKLLITNLIYCDSLQEKKGSNRLFLIITNF